MRTKCWRVRAPDGLAAAVQTLARQEGRSLSNMIERLISEAIVARGPRARVSHTDNNAAATARTTA
jgi:hypothetical protein